MWTSIAAKPARSNAAAISTWPLTPCSRRIAIAGRAPVAMKGAATSSAGSNVSTGDRPGSVASSSRAYSWSALAGLSRSRCSSCVVADHARCRSTRASSSSDSPSRTIEPDPVVRSPARRARMNGEARRHEAREDAGSVVGAHLHDGAQLLGEQHGERVAADGVERDVEPAARRKRHFAQRREQRRRRRRRDRRAAGLRRSAPAIAAKNAASRAGSSRSAQRRRAGRRPARAPIRRGDACPRRGRSRADSVSPRSSRSMRRQRAPRRPEPARTRRRSATPAP